MHTSFSEGISTLLRAPALHLSGISFCPEFSYPASSRESKRTSSTVVIPHSRFIQNPFSCQNGHSRYRSTWQSRQAGLTVVIGINHPEIPEEWSLDQLVQLLE